jgi:hypothetical protein
MTSSWSAIPLGVSAVAAAFACLVSLILVDAWYGLSDSELPRGIRAALLSVLGFQSQRTQRPTAGRVVLASIFLGGLIAICLSIPLRFLVDPEWVRANGINGQVSGLICLGGFVAWLLYLVRVYRSAAAVASGRTEAKPGTQRPPRSSLQIRLSSRLSPDECAEVLRSELPPLVRRDPGKEWGRAAEVGPVDGGSVLVTMSSSNLKLPRERQMPRRTRTWLVVHGTGGGSEIDVCLAARPWASVLGCWLLAGGALALLAVGLLVPPVQTPFLLAGGIALAKLVTCVVLFRVGRPIVLSDCRLLLGAVVRVLDADIVAMGRSMPGWVPLVSGYSPLSDVTLNDLSDLVAANRT